MTKNLYKSQSILLVCFVIISLLFVSCDTKYNNIINNDTINQLYKISAGVTNNSSAVDFNTAGLYPIIIAFTVYSILIIFCIIIQFVLIHKKTSIRNYSNETNNKYICNEEFSILKNDIKNLNAQVEELKSRINKLVEVTNNNFTTVKSDNSSNKDTQTDNIANNYNPLYATRSDSNSCFIMVTTSPDAETVYLLTQQNDNTVEFEIYDLAKERILKTREYLEHACEYDSNNNKGDIVTQEKGKAILQENGKWKVKNKAKIQFK